MIKISKEGHTIICSNGAYQSMYKRLGYEIVNDTKVQKVQETKEVKVKLEDEITDIPVVEVEVEKPTTKSKIGKNKK